MTDTPKNGRPSDYRREFDEQAEKLAKLGAIDREIADFFGISEQTLNTWKKKHPKFLESLNAGKKLADAEVASKLYHRAIGYSHPEVHVSNYQGAITLTPLTKHYPPDTAAGIFWLKNRRRKVDKSSVAWSDRQELTGADGGPVKTEEVSKVELARWLAYTLTQAAKET